MKRHWNPTGLVIVGLALAFVLGRATVGKRNGEPATPQDPTTVGAPGRRNESRWGAREGVLRRRGEREMAPAAAIRRAARLLMRSPMIGMDFNNLFDVYEEIRWMSPAEARAALDELEEMVGNPQARMVLENMLIGHWAKRDGREAVEYAIGCEQPRRRTAALMGGLTGWAKSDPEAAYFWYMENRDGMNSGMPERSLIVGMLFASMAREDMGRAFERLQTLPESEREAALVMIPSQMAMEPGQRRAFLAELDRLDAKTRRGGVRTALTQWAMEDPEGALAFFESRDWEEEFGEDLRDDLVSSWSFVDPKAALDWRLRTVRDGADRGAVVAPDLSRWIAQDPQSATDWIEKQPADLLTDALCEGAAEQMRLHGKYEQALQWAGQIGEAQSRGSRMGRIYQRWRDADRAAAGEWLERLDPALRAEVESAAGAHDVTPGATAVEEGGDSPNNNPSSW